VQSSQADKISFWLRTGWAKNTKGRRVSPSPSFNCAD